MPNELKVYKINFTNKKGDDIFLQIRDLKNYDASDPTTAAYYEYVLDGGANALEIETFSTNGTPYGVFGKRAVISFKSTADFGMHTFSEGEDGRFDVYAFSTLSNQIIFKGFVVMDDNEEQYVPPGTEVKIVATDGIGLLRGVELSDFDGVRLDPDIPVTRIKLLAYCLAKTGIGADIIIQDNLYSSLMLYRAVGGGDEMNNPWDQSWILPGTFLKEPNVYEDCFTVIDDLLGTNMRLSYGKLATGDSAFIVQRVHELKRDVISYTRFNPAGAAISGVIDDTSHIVNIGHANDHDVYFISRATRVSNRRPAKKVEVKYLFDIDPDLPRNKDFIRGDILTPLLDNGIVEYEVDDWRNTGYPLRPDLTTPPTNTARIWRVFEDRYEKERYLLLSNSTTQNYNISKPIYITADDKFSFSIDWRWSGNRTGAGSLTTELYHVVLQAFDGTNWFMDENGDWFQSSATWNTNVKAIQWIFSPNTTDETDWRTSTVDSKKAPRDGKLMFCLVNAGHLPGVTDDIYVLFQNTRFEYIPFRNSSYKKYKGERVTDTQTGRYSNPQENEVHISVSRKYLDKGALMNYNSGTGVITLLTDRWFDWTHYHATAETLLDKRIVLVALDHYNHYRNTQREFNLSMRGLVDEDGKLCNLHNVYRNSVNNLNNNNKSFVLVNMRQNWSTCAWTGTAVEIDDTRDQFAVAGSYTSEYKYIE
jgi:hypothetical protein